MASRNPLGEKASPPTVEGTSSILYASFAAALLARTKACLPADQAIAPSCASATWSIHRRFWSVATSVPLPFASVDITLPSSPPVMTCLPSAALSRIAPPCMSQRCGSPSFVASTNASSPSTKTGVLCRKCRPTTLPPTATGRMRSATEAISLVLSLMRDQRTSSRDAAFKACSNQLFGQFAPDEDRTAQAFLAVLPLPLVVAIKDHVYALEHKPLGVILEREDALAAQDARTFVLDQPLHPGKKLLGVERTVGRQRQGLHIFV